MEQTVKVRSLLPDGRAEVIHLRQSACSGDCHQCAEPERLEQTMVVPAENPIGARPGDLVVISSSFGGAEGGGCCVCAAHALVLRGLCAGGTDGYGRRLWLRRIPAGAGGSRMDGPPQEQKAENSIYDHRLCPPTGAQPIIEGGHWLGQKHDWIRPCRGNGERSGVYSGDPFGEQPISGLHGEDAPGILLC